MKRFLLTIAVLTIALTASAKERAYTVRSVPNVQVAAANRFVSNPDGILSATAVNTLDTMLMRLKDAHLAQVTVVALGSIGDASPREFAHELLNYWGLGEQSQDNGLMVLLVLDQGAIEIETGYGIEGDLPDAICKRVINNMMLPAFRERNFDSGMVRGMEAIAAILSGREVPESLKGGDDEESLVGLLGFFGFMAVIFVLILFVGRLATHCPKCKKGTLKRSGERILVKDDVFRKVYKVAYICPKCGHTVWRNESIDKNNGSHGGGIGPIIGGFGRGDGFGGGGFGGGGWGGGHSGGGGAGGRF